MRRRDFISGVAASAALAPTAGAQQKQSTPLVGWLSLVSLENSPALPFFQKGLADLGYVEGQNIKIEYRSAR
jgi:putative ABC transport system substrate-binding protein